jgi:cell division protease FtsH
MAPFNGFGKRMPSEAPPVLTPTEREKLKAQAEADGQVAVGGGSISTNQGSSNGTPEGNR